MTAAQRAMAMIYPEGGGKGGRGKKDGAKNLQETGRFSAERLRQARAILSHSPPVAYAVLAGSKSLDEAYNDVQAATGHRALQLKMWNTTSLLGR